MPTPRSAWIQVDLSPKMDNAEFGNGDVINVTYPVPRTGVIQEAWMGAAAPLDAGNLQLHKYLTSVSSVNLLTAVNVSISSNVISANSASQITLTSNRQHLKVEAGNILRAIWTYTTVGSADGQSLVVWIEPTIW